MEKWGDKLKTQTMDGGSPGEEEMGKIGKVQRSRSDNI